MQLTWVDVIPVDFHILVSVTPGLLMVEAQSMVEFMLDDAVVNTTALLEGDHLFASCPPKAGEAPEKDGRNNDSNSYNRVSLTYISVCINYCKFAFICSQNYDLQPGCV